MMDKEKKKALIQEYKNRAPEWSVICVRCIQTGESFIGTSTEPKASFNSIRFRLSVGQYRNSKLSMLWDQYGESGFSFDILKTIKSEETTKDLTDELDKCCSKILSEIPNATAL